MGANMNLAVVRGAQVMAVALMIGVAYSSTLGLLKPKKIDLHNHEQEQEVRPTPKVEHPNAWPPKPKTSVDPNMKVGPPSTQQLTKPKLQKQLWKHTRVYNEQASSYKMPHANKTHT